MSKKHSSQIYLACCALLLLIIFGTIFRVAQQMERRDANYPQIQLAEDTAASLDAGNKPTQLLNGHIDMNHSLAPYTIIYNLSGQPIAGNGYLDDKLPTVPIGVLRAAKGKTYHFVTWQPEHSLRFAAVAAVAKNYYVLSGRSLAEVENNEMQSFRSGVEGGLASLVVLLASFVLVKKSDK